MNDIQKDSLQIILSNELLLSAIRSVFEETIEDFTPKAGETDSNELLGQKFRAYETAVNLVKKGFINLESYKVDKKQEKRFNKER